MNEQTSKTNVFALPGDLPKPGDPACHREIQRNVDVSLKLGSIKKWSLDDIAKFGYRLLADVGLYDSVRNECKADFFYFVEAVLNKVSAPNEAGVRQFDYIRARHFRWMFQLIESITPTATDLMEMNRFRSRKDAPHPFNWASENTKHNKKLILDPRIHGKSTVGNIAYSMWRLYKNPDLRILDLSEIRDNAVTMLGVVKSLYQKIDETAKDPSSIIPHIMGKWVGDLWNEDSIRVKPRRVSLMAPSISIAGMETETVSQHFDIIIVDDAVGKKNTTTIEQIEKHCRTLAALTEVGDYGKDSWTLYLFLGTRHHFADYYSIVLSELASIYDILKLACWDLEEKEPLFPEKFTIEMLKEIRKEKLTSPHPEEWPNQWLNEPQDAERAIFKMDDFQWYNEIPKLHEIGIFVDSAWTRNKWSDYSAIVPVGLGESNTRYILPYWFFKEDDVNVFANNLIRIASGYHRNGLCVCGMEEGLMYQAIYPIIADKAPWLAQMMWPMKIKNRSKDERVIGLSGISKMKKLYMRRDMVEMIDQFLQFPRSTRRDLSDAAAYSLDWRPFSEFLPDYGDDDKPLSLSQKWQKRKKEQDNYYRELYG